MTKIAVFGHPKAVERYNLFAWFNQSLYIYSMEENKTTRTPPLNPWPSGTYGHHVYDQFAQDMVQIHDVGGDGHLRIIADYMRGCCGSVQLRKLPVIHYGGLRQLLNNLGTTLKITWNT